MFFTLVIVFLNDEYDMKLHNCTPEFLAKNVPIIVSGPNFAELTVVPE